MIYRLGMRNSRYIRMMSKLRAIRQPIMLGGVFVLGGIAGVAIVVQQHDPMATISGKVKGDRVVATRSDKSKSSNGADSKKFAGKTKGVSTSIGGIPVAADVRVSGSCGTVGSKRSGLASAVTAQLRKLAEYEDVCNGAVMSRMSFFVGTPKTVAAAPAEADWVADTLKEFASKGISPLVFMEPSTDDGSIDFAQYKAGAYDAALDAYFARLKAKGITDATMGTWVPFPESNIPVWESSASPADIAANITKTAQMQKKYFPGSKVAVMLQAMSYPSGTSWENGAYVSLLPYVQGIPKGLIDSFGMQGFAWPPTSPSDVAQLDPTDFLRPNLAREAATTLGAKEIWFNTGTFGKSVIVSKTSPYTLTPQQRQAILDGILKQAKSLKGQGFSVAVHMFNEDKSATEEGIDWSYWPKGQAATSPNTAVFKTFAADASAAGVPLWLFDQ